MDSHEHPVLLDLGCRTSGFRSTPAAHVPRSCSHVSPSMNQHLWRPKSADADHSHYKLTTGCVTHWYVILTFLRWLGCSNKTTRSRCSFHQQSAEALNRHTTNPPLFLNRKKPLSFANFKTKNQPRRLRLCVIFVLIKGKERWGKDGSRVKRKLSFPEARSLHLLNLSISERFQHTPVSKHAPSLNARSPAGQQPPGCFNSITKESRGIPALSTWSVIHFTLK